MNENPIPGSRSSASPLIVVDGIFFQRDRNGIARVWRSFLEQWTQTGFAAHVVVLDRNRTAPRFAGIRYHDVPEFDARAVGREMMQLERWCRELDADLFVSTYYTAPTRTPSLAMVYDMIFEVQSEHDRGSPDQEGKGAGVAARRPCRGHFPQHRQRRTALLSLHSARGHHRGALRG